MVESGFGIHASGILAVLIRVLVPERCVSKRATPEGTGQWLIRQNRPNRLTNEAEASFNAYISRSFHFAFALFVSKTTVSDVQTRSATMALDNARFGNSVRHPQPCNYFANSRNFENDSAEIFAAENATEEGFSRSADQEITADRPKI
ncbi:MAG: hypothetical protein ACTHLW_06340 [Verrucomicrobiota bacterium]